MAQYNYNFYDDGVNEQNVLTEGANVDMSVQSRRNEELITCGESPSPVKAPPTKSTSTQKKNEMISTKWQHCQE